MEHCQHLCRWCFGAVRQQAITWTNADLWIVLLLGTQFNETQVKTQQFSFNTMYLKMSSAKTTTILFRPSMCVLPLRLHSDLTGMYYSTILDKALVVVCLDPRFARNIAQMVTRFWQYGKRVNLVFWSCTYCCISSMTWLQKPPYGNIVKDTGDYTGTVNVVRLSRSQICRWHHDSTRFSMPVFNVNTTTHIMLSEWQHRRRSNQLAYHYFDVL